MDSYTGTFCTFSRICYAHLLRPFYKNYHLYPFNILVMDNCIRKTLTWPVLENFQCGSGIHFNFDSCTSYPYLLNTSLISPVLYKDYFLKSSKELIMTHWALLLYRAPIKQLSNINIYADMWQYSSNTSLGVAASG